MSTIKGISKADALQVKGSPATTCESPELDASNRLMKWKLHRTAQMLLPEERVAFCMRRVQAAAVDVLYSPNHQSAHYKGLMACGSVWVCPICAANISEHRRVELEQAITRCITNGGAVYLATYTISHKRYDTLATLLQSFLAARRKIKQGRAAQELHKQFDILGTISVREVTWSKLNGWHPHCHELVFCSTEIDVDAYDRVVREQWQRCVEREGLSINEHGFSVSRTFGSVADYVAKFGREPMRSPWGTATEMTKGHLKRGHTDEHLTPFAMLWLISQGREEFISVFREYAKWFKGKHQLVWSAGLRALLLEIEKEQTDEELAKTEETDTVLLGQLTRKQWWTILIYEAQGKLLEVARSGEWQRVVAFINTIGADSGHSPPFLGLVYNYEIDFHFAG